jgi:hypothetical protein
MLFLASSVLPIRSICYDSNNSPELRDNCLYREIDKQDHKRSGCEKKYNHDRHQKCEYLYSTNFDHSGNNSDTHFYAYYLFCGSGSVFY